MRPGSSMSQRPQQSAPSRPASSLSRPLSSASQRTASRVSHRPFSRLSQRPSTRQSRALCQTLVTKITGLVLDQDDGYDDAYDLAIRRIEAVGKQAVAPDLQMVQAQLRGLSRKARIQFHDELADAFDICGKKLTAETEKHGDLDDNISVSKLPEHLQLLFILSTRPSSSTLDFATQLVDRAQNPQSSPSGVTWAEILKEEPFEGEHWQGAYGLPPGSIVGQDDQERSMDSSASLSPVSDSELEDQDAPFSMLDSEGSSDVSVRVITPPPPTEGNNLHHRVAESLRLQFELETVRKRQYWRKDWRIDAEIDRLFDLSEPSTLRASFQRMMSPTDVNYQVEPENEQYINEHDAVREILISLQGRPSFLFERSLNRDGLPVTLVREDAPSLLHLTPSSQQSILSKFSHLATTLNRLRVFYTEVLRNIADVSPQRHNSRTIGAFAEALELEVTRFETYMAQKEEKIIRAHVQNGKSTVVSLLSLEIVIRDEFSNSFHELFRIVSSSFPGSSWLDRDRILGSVRFSPSSFSSRLSDLLFDAIQNNQSFGDTVTASRLRRVFLKTAEPVWKMLGRWLCDGIFMPESSNSAYDQNVLPQEFFIESNGLDITDADFWAQGYSNRTRSLDDDLSTERPDVPIFLQPLVDKILGAGKSIGLLRILGYGQNVEYGELSPAAWPTFENFMLKLFDGGSLLGSQRIDIPSAHLTSDNLSLLLSDHILPICTSAEKMLKNVLYSECDLLHHFHMVGDLLLCRRGDVMADFCDVLFSAIDSKKIWTDYHFLNTAYREAVDLRNAQDMDPSLVRLSYKSSGRTAQQRFVKCFDGLTVDYAAPFPFAFVIDSDSKQVYNAIFILLIKIRRAKTLLDNILLRGSAVNTFRAQDELKIFYTTRSKLSWFINTYMDFICSYVLHVEIESFHSSLRKADSLDDIIDLHQKHLNSIEKLCFLNEKTAPVHRALLSILDMSVTFSDYFVAFAGDTTLNMSRAPMSRSRRHRSRRQRREARDIVSLEPVQSFRDEESDSSDSDLDEPAIVQEIVGDDSQSFPVVSVSESFGEGDFFDRNEKTTKDLDSLVRYIRREAERLAQIAGGSQFGVLGFALQDWDL